MKERYPDPDVHHSQAEELIFAATRSLVVLPRNPPHRFMISSALEDRKLHSERNSETYFSFLTSRSLLSIDIVLVLASCKRFYQATKARKVGQCMSVHREWKLHWWNKEEFLALLRSCARCGNIEACYILGLELVYNRREKEVGLSFLKSAMAGGHYTAAYSMGIILFHDPATRSIGMELLNDLAAALIPESKRSGNPLTKLRKEAVSAMRKIFFSMERWPLEQSSPCRNQLCGKEAKIGNTNKWCDEEETPRSFCSQLCKWTYEYNMFLEKL